jgi:phosphate starvation-inducible membrane PsiE
MHATYLPIPSSLGSFYSYLAGSTSDAAPHTAIFFTMLLFHPSLVLPSALFSDTFSLLSVLTVRDQVSHPYKIAGRIIVLHILIFAF